MNGIAPNCLDDGFHSLDNRKSKPSSRMVGIELCVIMPIIAATTIKMTAAAAKSIVRNIASPVVLVWLTRAVTA